MEGFQIKYFSERLKEYAKTKHGSIKKLAESLEMLPGEISNYTKKKNPREPRTEFLFRLRAIGCDVNSLLDGLPAAISVVKEETNTASDYKFKALEERITKLESKLFQLTEENEQLKIEKAKLCVEIATLTKGLAKSSMS